MHSQEKAPVTLLYIILTTVFVGIKQTRLSPVYISSLIASYDFIFMSMRMKSVSTSKHTQLVCFPKCYSLPFEEFHPLADTHCVAAWIELRGHVVS